MNKSTSLVVALKKTQVEGETCYINRVFSARYAKKKKFLNTRTGGQEVTLYVTR